MIDARIPVRDAARRSSRATAPRKLQMRRVLRLNESACVQRVLDKCKMVDGVRRNARDRGLLGAQRTVVSRTICSILA